MDEAHEREHKILLWSYITKVNCLLVHVCVCIFFFLGGGVIASSGTYSEVETCLYPVFKAVRVLSILTAKNRWNCL